MKNRNLKHSDNWKTPPELYEKLDEKYHFDFDPCPYTEDEILFNGLECEWGNSNYVNPPYSKKLKEAFIMKAIEESKKGKLCVMLLPVSTSTKIFHEHILLNKSEIIFIRGRVPFHGYNSKGEWVTGKKGTMHDSMLVIFDGRNNG